MSTDQAIITQDEYPRKDRRRKNLTEEDLLSISEIIDDVLRKRVHTDAACRFVGITPEDLRAMVEAHKKFNAAMEDSKTIVRRFVVYAILAGMGGIALVGWWETVAKHIKKTVTGE